MRLLRYIQIYIICYNRSMKYKYHSAHLPSRSDRNRGVKNGLSISIAQKLSAVPLNVRGLLADTLVEWMEAVQDDRLLHEKIQNINADFLNGKLQSSLLVQEWSSLLDAEIRRARENVRHVLNAIDQSQEHSVVCEVIPDPAQHGRHQRRYLSHRTGRTGRTPSKARKVF